MKMSFTQTFSIRFWLIVICGFVIIIGGICFNTVSAQANLSRQNAVTGKLAFGRLVRNFGGLTDNTIGIMNADGTGSTIIWGFPPGVEPAWSPDGTKIVFSVRTVGLIIINEFGGGQTFLTTAQGANYLTPSWSANNVIAYVRNNRIWLINSDGTNNREFTAVNRDAFNPKWSANGAKLVYESGSKLWTINANGTNERVLPAPINAQTPAWSPDGTKIVYQKTGTGGIAFTDADGTSETILTNVGSDLTPSWSPDGTTIAFRRGGYSTPDPIGGIYLMNTDGSNQVRIKADVPGPVGSQGDFFLAPTWKPDPSLQAPRRTNFDFDGDGRADLGVFRPSNFVWYQLLGSNYNFSWSQYGLPNDILTPADYDGDGKTDISIFRPSTGQWVYGDQQFVVGWGQAGDIPLPSDVDGDGKADFVVFRPSERNWYRITNGTGNYTFVPFGAVGDQPLIGDFDGDGKADPAVFRPSSGEWYYAASSQGGVHLRAAVWGLAGDKLVPADYDGDGKTDAAIYRDGLWAIYNSGNGSNTLLTFGQAGDKPVAADYDGDGKADVGVYRPSDGTWYLLRSTSGFQALGFGASADLPIPNSFVQ